MPRWETLNIIRRAWWFANASAKAHGFTGFRCHEKADAVWQVLDLMRVDGYFLACEHSWVTLEELIIDTAPNNLGTAEFIHSLFADSLIGRLYAPRRLPHIVLDEFMLTYLIIMLQKSLAYHEMRRRME